MTSWVAAGLKYVRNRLQFTHRHDVRKQVVVGMLSCVGLEVFAAAAAAAAAAYDVDVCGRCISSSSSRDVVAAETP